MSADVSDRRRNDRPGATPGKPPSPRRLPKIDDEIAEAGVAAGHEELRDLDGAGKQYQPDRGGIARTIAEAERKGGRRKDGEVLERVKSTKSWPQFGRHQRRRRSEAMLRRGRPSSWESQLRPKPERRLRR